uniref:Serpentine receptor class gamma n=1 Tax=Steinernema glaseri TaxID=37863 RepID=A0A1I7Z121_9BILA
MARNLYGIAYVVSAAVPIPLYSTVIFIVMNLLNAVFNGTIIMIWALAANRFLVIILSSLLTVPSAVYAIIIIFAWSYVTAIFSISVAGLLERTYNPLYFMPTFGPRSSWRVYTKYADAYLGYFSYGSALVIYTVVAVYLIVRRFLLKSIQHNYTKEFIILGQGIFLFFGGILIMLTSTLGVSVFPAVHWYTGTYNVFIIFFSGLFNPLLYLTMN